MLKKCVRGILKSIRVIGTLSPILLFVFLIVMGIIGLCTGEYEKGLFILGLPVAIILVAVIFDKLEKWSAK